jgi:hypothetical protein
MEVIMKSAVSWDSMPCSVIELYQFSEDCIASCDYQTSRHQIPEGSSLQFTISFREQLKALLFLST